MVRCSPCKRQKWGLRWRQSVYDICCLEGSFSLNFWSFWACVSALKTDKHTLQDLLGFHRLTWFSSHSRRPVSLDSDRSINQVRFPLILGRFGCSQGLRKLTNIAFSLIRFRFGKWSVPVFQSCSKARVWAPIDPRKGLTTAFLSLQNRKEIGEHAYLLKLPATWTIHPVLHAQ